MNAHCGRLAAATHHLRRDVLPRNSTPPWTTRSAAVTRADLHQFFYSAPKGVAGW